MHPLHTMPDVIHICVDINSSGRSPVSLAMTPRGTPHLLHNLQYPAGVRHDARCEWAQDKWTGLRLRLGYFRFWKRQKAQSVIVGGCLKLYFYHHPLCASHRDHPSRANPRPRRLHQLRHAPLATCSVRVDRALRNPLRSCPDRRDGGQWRRWKRDQSEHGGRSLPETNRALRLQQYPADGPEARHHLHRHAHPGVKPTSVQQTLCLLHH